MSPRYRYTFNKGFDSLTTDNHEVLYGSELPEGARLLPPCVPSKIVCVGRNYVAHAKELGNEVPTEPLIFLKPPSSLIASGDSIVYPSISENVNFEGELGVVIGKRARHVPRESALE
ncbi:MAG: fumarylacetoacetate hydrolase family protein, partial [Bryobacteraceae bacterium]